MISNEPLVKSGLTYLRYMQYAIGILPMTKGSPPLVESYDRHGQRSACLTRNTGPAVSGDVAK